MALSMGTFLSLLPLYALHLGASYVDLGLIGAVSHSHPIHTFQKRLRRRVNLAVGMAKGVLGVGWIIGPLISGAIAQYVSPLHPYIVLRRRDGGDNTSHPVA